MDVPDLCLGDLPLLSTLEAVQLADETRRAAGGPPVSVRSWRAIVARSGIEPDLRVAGRPLWIAPTVQRVMSTAKGRGFRTDRISRPHPAAHGMMVTIHGIPAPMAFDFATLADWLGVSQATVRHWSANGSGPRRRRDGRDVFFEPKDVRVWLEDRLFRRPRCRVTLAIVAKNPGLRDLVGPVHAPRRSAGFDEQWRARDVSAP